MRWKQSWDLRGVTTFVWCMYLFALTKKSVRDFRGSRDRDSWKEVSRVPWNIANMSFQY